MDKTTRYLILVFIFIVFLALAPVIVLYVSGRNFNFNEFTNGTGILDVQTDPTGAQVYLNNKLTDETPATIRFITQGTYHISLNKTGFHPWQKQLFIEAGQVTYTGTLNDAVKLLPNNPPLQIIDKQIKTFLVVNDIILYIDKDNLAYVYDLGQAKVLRTSQIKTNIKQLEKALDSNFVLVRTDNEQLQVLDLRSLILTELPTQIATAQNIELTSDQNLVAQQGSSLLAYTIASSKAPQLMMPNIRAFTTAGNGIYIAKSGADSLQTYLWDGKAMLLQNTLYSGKIDEGQKTQLLLTDHRELFLSVDRSLYRVNRQPELLNNQVELVKFDSSRQLLTFKTPTEIYFYNFSSGLAELFYRTSESVSKVFVIPDLGYGFAAVDQRVIAIEIDKRNGQNQYSIFKGSPVVMMESSGNEKQLVILADQKLYTLIVD